MTSKNFKPEEIKGITIENGKKVIYLKQGVKRLSYPTLDDSTMDQLNHELVNYESYLAYLKKIGYESDFSNAEE